MVRSWGVSILRVNFVFVLRFYGPVNPMGSWWAWSVYLTTRLLGRLSPHKQLTSIVHILSPETDNCPSWISGRERMTVENISWSISTKECCRPRRGLNPRPPGSQSAHPTETKGKYGKVTNTEIKWLIISKSIMIIIFVEFIDQLINYPINRASHMYHYVGLPYSNYLRET